MTKNPYQTDLDRNPANYEPLTPLTFLPRSAEVYPDKTAIIHGDLRFTYREFYARARRLASALKGRGIGEGDTVSMMAPNIPAVLEAHFGVPMIGAILNTLNTRLDAPALAFILDHGECRLLLTDREFSPLIKEALSLAKVKPIVIDIDDALAEGGDFIGDMEYEAFLATGDPEFEWKGPADEWQAISLNYTSGTTGDPKGVVYHHRGAYLAAMGNSVSWSLPKHPVYLWTLPMFHCNGWCFPWTLTAVGGTHVCLRKIEASAIYHEMQHCQVDHMCGAPIILSMLINASPEDKAKAPSGVKFMVAAAPPPATVLAEMDSMGFDVTHVYGLTETYGPAVLCDWNSDWDSRQVEDRAALKARQGVRYHALAGLEVMDPETMTPVPNDGNTMGEVMLRGNLIMKGYLKNPKTTQASFKDGWFHSGDLGVVHEDGYLELRDRSKDIIISGGENISTIEVEGVLYKHPAVLEAAVVARPDEKWGETPCAFVVLRQGASATADDIIKFCRENMAHFKCPKTIVFEELPKTSTGKVQKFVLRERARNL
ncbi:AMP-binding protein [Sneathiella chungangensis]|uniref:3-methylmercaptopropionyl-CoA ligase n=1 Tax=Sneathiella chungangensis TaxID=1418234 RepID=A0A845MFK4_9PROT|nr:acyl-CoA synthetase [Sneathiella chungangensis]MZR22639.1 AMP-binding protein [Sneathiella chungangensis]